MVIISILHIFFKYFTKIIIYKKSIDKAIKILQARYEYAKKQKWIYNPLAYALYEVWRLADDNKEKKKGGAE